MPSKKGSKTGGGEYRHQPGRPWKLVIVRWRDAATKHEWVDEKTFVTTPVCLAVGLLRSRTATETIICQNIADDSQLFGQLVIPAGMVEGVEEVEEIADIYVKSEQ